jgi:uncharacterized protein (DUF302 family)
MSEQLGYEVHLDEGYEQAIEKVTEALKAKGFGVLTSIDVKGAFKEKLGEEFRPYAILGACNPKLAYRALNTSSEVGLMLPCNVTVEANPEGGTIVRIINPRVMLSGAAIEDAVMEEIAAEAADLLVQVAETLAPGILKQ